MKYTEENLFSEFPWRSSYRNTKFLNIVNAYYGIIRDLPISEVKALLPITFLGEDGCHIEPWMVRKMPNGTVKGAIWDRKGDRTGCEVCSVFGGSEDEVYRKLLIEYMSFIRFTDKEFQKIKATLNRYGKNEENSH